MGELLKTFGVDWKLLLTQMLNFAVLFFILKKFAYGPVLSMLEKRRQIIAKGLDDASEAKKSLTDAHQNADEIKKQAKIEANAIFDDAQNEARSFTTKTKNDALVEKSKIIESAYVEIESIKQKNEKLLKDGAVDHIVSGIKSILSEEMTPEMNSRIISKLIEKSN